MSRTPLILVAEDNQADQALFAQALKAGGSTSRVQFVDDGEAVLTFLRSQAAFPQLIVLDLGLPKKNGAQVLKELKEDPQWRRIPVVLLATSASEADIKSVYELNANCFVKKPADLEAFFSVIQAIEVFWLDMVTLPT